MFVCTCMGVCVRECSWNPIHPSSVVRGAVRPRNNPRGPRIKCVFSHVEFLPPLVPFELLSLSLPLLLHLSIQFPPFLLLTASKVLGKEGRGGRGRMSMRERREGKKRKDGRKGKRGGRKPKERESIGFQFQCLFFKAIICLTVHVVVLYKR